MVRVIFILALFYSFMFGAKIKDITSVVGVRGNHLIGYGLVVGLKGKGDGDNVLTNQSLTNMLKGVNVKVDEIDSKNIAAVMVTAELPAFAKQGDRIDVTVSSIGKAESLEDGTLLMTPLKGVDGRIYGLAQGQITLGSQIKSKSRSGSIPAGGLIEREIKNDIYNSNVSVLSLKKPNFTNAVSIQNTINSFFNEKDKKIAKAIDGGTVEVTKPKNLTMIEFLATLQNINVQYNLDDKIIVDEKSGTIVAGSEIEIDPVVITNGNITIKVPSLEDVKNTFDAREGLGIDGANGLVSIDSEKPTVANVVRALAKLGANPQRIIAILEAIKKAGAIQVELEVI